MSIASAACRSCGHDKLQLIISLGKMPLANALLTADQLNQPEPTYPLELAFCPNCSLVQITETVPPEQLFRDYLYFSSFSDTTLKHAEQLVHWLIEKRSLNNNSLVVELASNDGYLLQYCVNMGIPVLGIEPAFNVAKVAEERGVRTLCQFFSEKVANELWERGQTADVIIANNVLAHVADLGSFVKGIRILMKKGGIAVIEAPYVKDLLDRTEFDTIYHEHLCYFSVTALDFLFKQYGLLLADVERIPIHGGSLRLFITHEGEAISSNNVRESLREEKAWGVDKLDSYLDFKEKVMRVKSSLRRLLRKLKREGKRISAYGAAAKGAVLLNYCQVGEYLDFVVDRSTYKQGRYMPGVHLPIYPASRLLEDMPDYTLLLTWNFADEILAQQAEYRQRGGKFIVPIPEVKIV